MPGFYRLKFAANLSMLFNEVPFLERFGAAAEAGFKGVEFLFPYEHPPEAIQEQVLKHNLEIVLFNMPPGDWAAGERGLASSPGREDPAACKATLISNLKYAADRLAPYGITVLLEAINHRDIPGFFVNTQAECYEICAAVGAPNLRMQIDLYHMQIMEGDLATKIRRYLPHCGHIQIAGPPHRHEPDTGEINYPYLFRLLDELGYDGWIGCEYRPASSTTSGLRWLRAL
jgi:hydroxypyruvate isomerase